MAKISLDLSTIKSAGIYTIEIDETQRTETQVNALRLLVGFNNKGPFNRPVLLRNDSQRQKLFGDIDAKLENKGCFFNKSLRTMLEGGPVLALNLLKVDDSFNGPDQVNYVALSLDAGKKNPAVADPGLAYGEVDYQAETIDKILYETKAGDTIPYVGKTPYASLFDRSRFWTPSDTNLLNVAAIGLGTKDSGSYERTNFLNFANTGTDEISILVYKPEGFTGYDMTAADWYGGAENIPYKWIRPSDFVSDYFIRVVAVKGNWTNYAQLSSSKTWGKFFDKNGIIKEKIYQFLDTEGVSFIGSWNGSIIPGFTDKTGNYVYIKDRVNAHTESTGVLMSINEDAMQVISYDLNGMDMTTGDASGHGAWIYDYDGNSEGESDAGETEVSDNGFLIDMVGHSFQKGVKKSANWEQLGAYTLDHTSFDASTGTLASGNSVIYIDDAAVVGIDGATNVGALKTPSFNSSGKKEYVYGIYDASTNRRLKDEYCYIVLTEDEKEIASESIKLKKACNLKGVESADGKTIGQVFTALGIDTTHTLKIKADQVDNTKYVDVPVLYGTYAGISADAKKLHIFEVFNGATGTSIEETAIINIKNLSTEMVDYGGAGAQKALKLFTNNGVTYGWDATAVDPNNRLYIKSQGMVADYYGVSFLSYNYVSNVEHEVLANIMSAFYFNGQKTTSNVDVYDQKITFGDSNVFVGDAPVNEEMKNMFIVSDEAEAQKITIGDLIPNIAYYNNEGVATTYGIIPGVTRVVKKVFVSLRATNEFTYDGGTYTLNTNVVTPIETKTGKRGFFLFTTVDPILISKDNTITRQLPISSDVISHSLKFIPLKGLKIASRHQPGYDTNGRINVNAGVEKIYSVLLEEGIRRGLCNQNMVDYRYIVDSMGNGIDAEMGGKRFLSMLAKMRSKTTALLNMPSKRQFELSKDPYFCATYDAEAYVKPAFDTKFIATGGNVDMYSTVQFSLPSEDDGAKYAAAFYPYFIYKENGRETLVPPAADVSNTLVQKFNGGNPYVIAANRNGRIQNELISGLECDVDDEDRDVLEPFGVNSIIRENGQYIIYGNQTCYQTVKSDYNKLHVRENLNTLEIACDAVLKDYNFLYNTAAVRSQVVTALTPILEAMKNSNAIEAYELQCDENNNTDELILDDFGIVDISVWMNHGMEKLVQRIRLRRRDSLPR